MLNILESPHPQQVAEILKLPNQGFILIGTTSGFTGVFVMESVRNGFGDKATNKLDLAFVFPSRDEAKAHRRGNNWQVADLSFLHKIYQIRENWL